jgi:hypothetical protein
MFTYLVTCRTACEPPRADWIALGFLARTIADAGRVLWQSLLVFAALQLARTQIAVQPLCDFANNVANVGR